MVEKRIIKCPFCEKRDISTIFIPRMKITKYARGSATTKAMNYFKDEKYEVISDKCPNCGKSKKEIEKALKHGKELSKDEVLRRLREAGLDPAKLK